MNIPLIRIYELADLLEKAGHKRVSPVNKKLEIDIYEQPDGNATVLIPGIINRPSIGINSPEDFFKELQKEIQHHFPKIKKMVFEGNGTITIPDWFKKWCKDNGIEINLAENEILKQLLSRDARETFGDLIDLI